MKTKDLLYEFSICREKGVKHNSFKLVKDKLIINCQITDEKSKEALDGKMIFSRKNNNVNFDWNLPDRFNKDDFFPYSILKAKKYFKLRPNQLLLDTPYLFMAYELKRDLEKMPIYYFDTRLSQKAVPFTGKSELEADGRNLAIVIDRILKDDADREKFIRLVRNILPFVENIDAKIIEDRSLFYRLKENNSNDYLPAFALSDGTINILEIIIAIYFEKGSSLIIEEPERNIHPALVSKLAGMFKDVSSKRQLIITTHSPELLKFIDLDNIYFIKRDECGHSVIIQPKKIKRVREFLKNEIGIDELFVKNLLK
jgi:AAA15 family ATPase/GTPase